MDSPHADNATLYQRARRILAAGINHELRHAVPHPIYVQRASGAYKWDVEGKRYIDYRMGSASQMLGHSHPQVMQAIGEQLALTPFTADCHALEIEWAEQLGALFPSAERVRMTASGTEATMLALRLARAHSERDKVLRIEGHFHGWHDLLLTGTKPGLEGAPSLGVPQTIQDLTVVVPPCLQQVADQLERDPDIACVFVEVSGANYGAVPLPADFLAELRALTQRSGHLLVFDEIITGLRWSPGGLQARDGIVPDLTTLAKIVTGGLPGGAVLGRAEVMDLLDPANVRAGFSPPVSHKGTFNAAPIIAAGAVAALPLLSTGEAQAHADAMAERLRAGLRGIFQQRDIEAAAYGESSTFHLYFGASVEQIPHLDASTLRSQPKALVTDLHQGLLQRGVDLMSQTSGVLSSAHTPEDIDQSLQMFDDTLQTLKQQGVLEHG